MVGEWAAGVSIISSQGGWAGGRQASGQGLNKDDVFISLPQTEKLYKISHLRMMLFFTKLISPLFSVGNFESRPMLR